MMCSAGTLARPNRLWPAVLAVLCLAAVPANAGPKKEGTVIPPGDVRSEYGFYSVVFYYAPDPKADPLATAKALMKEYLPEVSFGTDNSAKPPFVGYQEESAPLQDYPVPDTPYFKFAGRGLEDGDIAAMQKTAKATCLVLVAPKDQVWTLGRSFTELVSAFAEKTGAYLWDSATRECFSPEAWKEMRLGAWQKGGLPEICDQITIHLYRPNENSSSLRAITLGMEKFALPDVVIERLLGSNNQQGGSLMNLVCQSLADNPMIEEGGKVDFNLASLSAKDFRERMTKSLGKGATGKITLQLLRGQPSEGDPENDLIELSFAHGQGTSENERRIDLLSKLWGAYDSVVSVEHTDDVRKASEKAKARLPELKKQFDQGLSPGDRLLVKSPFARDDEGFEWMWVEVVSWPSDKMIEGVLQNDPFYVKSLKAGAPVNVQVGEIFDYLLVKRDGTREGNETRKLFEKQGGKKTEK